MLDVRPLSYVSPLTEQEIGPITPVIRLRNLADEDATVTGLFRIYRDSTGLLEYSSDLAVTPLAHGTMADAAALTPFSPGAVADDDYFVICELEYHSIQTGNVTRGTLGPFYFDTKAPPMGPVPTGHHTTHEAAGMDEIDLAGMSGLLADPQTPETHAGTHEDGQADEVNVEGLHGELADDQPALAHDIAGARHTSTATPAQLLQADANGLPVDATNTDADVAAAVGASHDRQHAITDTADHTSTATPAKLLQADANGLPVDATNTDADVAAAVGASHAQNTDTDLETVFEATLEKVANKGVAGGYCGLPNPLNTLLPLRADGTPARPGGCFLEAECMNPSSAGAGFAVNANSSGTCASVAGPSNHPGIARFTSSTTANSGGSLRTSYPEVGILLAGNETGDCVLRPQTLSGTTIRYGFHDQILWAAIVDGVYIEMAPATGLITGHTRSNSVESVTGTSLQIVTNTWYRWRIVVNANATRVDFYCLDEAGAVLWTDNLTTNIPTAAGREVGYSANANNSGTTAVALVDIDYASLEIARVLVR